jgi:Ca2+-transporting ATPase
MGVLPPSAACATRWCKLAAQFKQLVIYILLTAALFSMVPGEWLETGAILTIVVLNALLGFFQERKAESALASLKQLSAVEIAKIVRCRFTPAKAMAAPVLQL